jgi:glycosyltransferase involved in cell wall biosynthesis
VPELTMLLQSFKPDVVHFHHSLLIGVEMIQLAKRVVPNARIVFTLHDYYMICANDGQMVKTKTHELCRQASPDACHKCFPDAGSDRFVLRTKHIQNMLGAVDRFLAPSEFLRTRYVAWGLPEEKIQVLRNGRPAAHALPAREIAVEGKRNSFAYFGNLSPYKGVMVAIEAARLLAEGGRNDFSLTVHGGMPFQSDAFKDGFTKAVAANARVVTHRGPYSTDEMAALMRGADWVIVPSIWWENAPLVIQEALQQRRPVICSNIGGMAEAVRDGVDGLHFRAGDASDLARVMAAAMETPGLWDKLAGQIGLVRTVAESAAEHAALYQSLAQVQVPA